MYNYIKYLSIFIVFICCISTVQAKPIKDVYGGVNDGQTIYYSFKSNKWSYIKPKHNKNKILVVTKGLDVEGYSEYVSEYEQVYYPAGSNYEFLHKGRLITYHINELKFFEIVYNKQNKAFLEVPLEEKELKKIMGNPKIIYISDFNSDYKLSLLKFPFKLQKYLILNDTDRYFYNYNINAPHKDSTIKTLFEVKNSCVLYFAPSESEMQDFPTYKLNIKF